MKTISQLNNKKVFLISLYPTHLINKNKIEKINQELKRLSEKYNFTYIDIIEITHNSDFFTLKKNYYPNYKGQEYIYKAIQKELEVKTLKIY